MILCGGVSHFSMYVFRFIDNMPVMRIGVRISEGWWGILGVFDCVRRFVTDRQKFCQLSDLPGKR